MSGPELSSQIESRSLAAVLDEIIPPSADGRLPGGGDAVRAGLTDGTIASVPGLDVALQAGLSALEAAAAKRGAKGFVDLSRDDKLAVLNEVGTADAVFLPMAMFLAFASYYRHAPVLEAMNLEARPPHPKGHEMEPGDLSLVEPVRRRGKIYREV